MNNSSSPGQNGLHMTEIFKCTFLNEKLRILLEMSLKFVAKGLIDNNLTGSMTRICGTKGKWFNSLILQGGFSGTEVEPCVAAATVINTRNMGKLVHT